MMAGERLPQVIYNPTSAAGAALALICTLALVVLLVVGALIEPASNPYFGIFIFLVLPAGLLLGLLLIPMGMVRERRRRRREGETSPAWPIIDLNQAAYRNALFVFVIGTIVFLIIGAAATYGAYHYSESVVFCGITCHRVMEPEYTTYQRSPHARVRCASCHVGSGASWYVWSKLSGAYQIYAVAARRYPTPIPTPIESLRPAQDTCERCHWPQHIYGAQQRQFNHYLYDATSSHWPINLLIKTGGGDPRTGQTAGIHWHMNIGVEVEYIARDHERQDIPWVRVTDRRTGRVTVYQSRDEPLAPEEVASATPRVMDCMDCHNRPSHIFRSPDEAIDQAILMKEISPEVPGIKRVAVRAMGGDYATREEARREIANHVTDHYRKTEPHAYTRLGVAIDQAVLAVQAAYARNVFPAMRARWSAYPDNIGHFYSRGCMRCHDGGHASADGIVLTEDCRACHAILAQGAGERLQVATSQEGLEFAHPVDIGEAWKEMGCYECHTGIEP
jgi:nitrate/TMAO reductase-like tetraheme cytochrome c subunit